MNTGTGDGDFYQLFEIARDADEAAIRAAIKAARRRWRQLTGSPDKDRARLAEQRMEQLEAAETVLLDQEARARYDAEAGDGEPTPAPTPTPAPESWQPAAPAPLTINWGERANQYYDDGDFHNAFLAAKKGTDLVTDDHLAWSVYGWSAIKLKRHQDADFASAELVHRLPDEASAYDLRGSALDAVGRYKDAEAAFRAGSRFAPAPTSAYYQGRAAWAMLDQGRTREAIAEAWAIFDRFPEDEYPARVLRAAAERFREAGRPQESLSIIASMLSKRVPEEETIAAAEVSIEAMADAGQIDAAVTETWRLLDAYPQRERTQNTVRHVNHCLRQHGRSSEAVVHARHFLSRLPDDQAARGLLAWARVNDVWERLSKDSAGTCYIVNKAQADYFGEGISEIRGLGVVDADLDVEIARMQSYLAQQTRTKVKLNFGKIVLWILALLMLLGGLGDLTNGGLIWAIIGGLLGWAAYVLTIKKQYRLTYREVHPALRIAGLR